MDECRGRALPVEEAYPALGLEELEAEGANLDYVGPTLPDAPALSAPTESTLDLDPSSQQSEPTHEVSVNGIPHSQQPWIGENNDSTSTPTRQENRATSLSVCRSIERALDSRAASPEPPVSAPLSPAASPSPGTAHGPSPDPMPVPFPSSVPPGSLLPPNSPLVSPPPNLLPPVQQSMAELPDSHTPSDTPSSPTPLRAGIRTRNGETAGIGTSATSRPSNIASDKAPNSKKRQRADTSTASSSLPKKARIADTASSLPPTVISVPADAPEWLSKAISMFSDSNLGPRWMMLVSLWVSFEEKQGKTASAISTLSATGRPAAIGDWIRRARNPTWRPKITNVKAYEKTHTKWWISVQPRWRVAKGRILADANGDWAELQKRSGINGLLSAIASLFFWRAGGGNGKKLASWDSSVEDFILVLTHLDRN